MREQESNRSADLAIGTSLMKQGSPEGKRTANQLTEVVPEIMGNA